MDIMRETFTEKVNSFSAYGREVIVTFSVHAADYRLSGDSRDFAEHMANLVAAWQERKAVEIVVNGTEIVSVGKVG